MPGRGNPVYLEESLCMVHRRSFTGSPMNNSTVAWKANASTSEVKLADVLEAAAEKLRAIIAKVEAVAEIKPDNQFRITEIRHFEDFY